MASKKQIKSVKSAQVKKALATAHGAWGDFALQTSGSTQEEQQFNRESAEFLSASWLAFTRVYADKMDALHGPTWFAKGL